MPIFWEYDTSDSQPHKRRKTIEAKMARRKSNGDGDQLASAHNGQGSKDDAGNPANATYLTNDTQLVAVRTGSREELMERIKRGERPMWVPSTNLQNLYMAEEGQQIQHSPSLHTEDCRKKVFEEDRLVEDPFFGHWTEGCTNLDNPGSALHRGDFNGSISPQIKSRNALSTDFTGTPTGSPVKPSPPWSLTNSSQAIGSTPIDVRPFEGPTKLMDGRRRTPSLGSSLSSSFILRTPTSPLAHAVDTSDRELVPRRNDRVPASTDNSARRRTMPPNLFQSLCMSPTESPPLNFSRPFVGASREASQSQGSHRPRRSLSSFTYQPASSPSTPRPQIRRLSLASDSSPRQHASMVGSFEESILRGRMSSPASQPFDFMAQIGVMGKGDCPPSLKCPAHVSVPFRAVFYNYTSSSRTSSVADDAPSPYVGTIDLEHHLKPIWLSTKSKSKSDRASVDNDPRAPENTPIGKALARDAERKQRSDLRKVNLGGAYRIPQKGQVQIIIKNPNKTAVKLFLIPYDLEGMQAGTKTFVRQRSYSRGPIFEDTDTTRGIANLRDPLKDKHILRYLIHIWFCCPSEGKYYLHDHIRVVFANRVPDGREKLDNEIQLPHPRYSTFRLPLQMRKDSQSLPESLAPLDTGLKPTSSSIKVEIAHEEFTISPEIMISTPTVSKEVSRSPVISRKIISVPLHFISKTDEKTSSVPVNEEGSGVLEMLSDCSPIATPTASLVPDPSRALSPVQGFHPSTSTRSSPIPWGSSSTSSTTRSFSPVPVEPGDGLLSRQFRSIYGNDAAGPPMAQVLDSSSCDAVLPTSDHNKLITDKALKSGGDSESREEHSEQGDISLTVPI